MSAFDRLMQKQEQALKLRQELRAGIKACTYMIKLYSRTGKQHQSDALQTFVLNTEVSK